MADIFPIQIGTPLPPGWYPGAPDGQRPAPAWRYFVACHPNGDFEVLDLLTASDEQQQYLATKGVRFAPLIRSPKLTAETVRVRCAVAVGAEGEPRIAQVRANRTDREAASDALAELCTRGLCHVQFIEAEVIRPVPATINARVVNGQQQPTTPDAPQT